MRETQRQLEFTSEPHADFVFWIEGGRQLLVIAGIVAGAFAGLFAWRGASSSSQIASTQ